LKIPCEVILTGASAGRLMGHIRPSVDIDFEIRAKSKRDQPRLQAVLDGVIRKLCSELGVAANYSGDISRWGEVSYLDYRKTARPYRQFGALDVKLIHPAYWTIGKMTRYLEQDIRDMAAILKEHRIDPVPLISLWAKALRQSNLSLSLSQFKEHVEDFLKRHARAVWGEQCRSEELIRRFQRALGR